MSQAKTEAIPTVEASYRRGYRLGWLAATAAMERLTAAVGVSIPTAAALMQYHAKVELGRWERKERADRKLLPPPLPAIVKGSGADGQGADETAPVLRCWLVLLGIYNEMGRATNWGEAD